mgnify:CR=1 FL=1
MRSFIKWTPLERRGTHGSKIFLQRNMCENGSRRSTWLYMSMVLSQDLQLFSHVCFINMFCTFLSLLSSFMWLFCIDILPVQTYLQNITHSQHRHSVCRTIICKIQENMTKAVHLLFGLTSVFCLILCKWCFIVNAKLRSHF